MRVSTFHTTAAVRSATGWPWVARRRHMPPNKRPTASRWTSSVNGIVSRVTPVHTAVRNCTRDEGGPFEFGNQVLISSHRKLLSSKAMVVNVAEKPELDFGRVV